MHIWSMKRDTLLFQCFMNTTKTILCKNTNITKHQSLSLVRVYIIAINVVVVVSSTRMGYTSNCIYVNLHFWLLVIFVTNIFVFFWILNFAVTMRVVCRRDFSDFNSNSLFLHNGLVELYNDGQAISINVVPSISINAWEKILFRCEFTCFRDCCCSLCCMCEGSRIFFRKDSFYVHNLIIS